jgi:O-antigen/teichoic acid export membrane protein
VKTPQSSSEDLPDIGTDELEPSTRARDDATGRTRLTRNVLSSWAGYLVFIAAGFIMPRMIDAHLGQVLLGIWDFCWSLVTYLRITQLGIGASINRYISRHRADQDYDGLNRTASSVMGVQLVAACIAALITATLVFLLPRMFGNRLGSHIVEAQWIVGWLGASVAFDMAFNVYRGILTGCHRWDLHNMIDAVSYAAAVALMLTVLRLGGGIDLVAFSYFLGDLVWQIVRCVFAYRVCPELRIRARSANLRTARKMLAFGFKSAINPMSRLILTQANALQVTWVLGPAALAVYNRPNALVRNVEAFVNKLALILVPTASSMQASGKTEDLRELVLQTTRSATAFALPAMVFLGVLGGDVLNVWMGPAYARGDLLALIAFGYLLPLIQQPAIGVLRGMNQHRFVAMSSIASAVVGIILSFLFVGIWQWGLVGAALAVGLPMTIGNGVLLGAYTCRQFSIGPVEFVRRALAVPAACCVPLAAALVVLRTAPIQSPALRVAAGAVVSAGVLLPLYWRFLLPPTTKHRLLKRIGLSAVPV